jgi:hypothetical protein
MEIRRTVERQTVRLCTDYELDRYRQCRRAIYESDEKVWVVPETRPARFFENSRAEIPCRGEVPLEGLDPTLDIPGETSIDLREWEEMDAAPRASMVFAVLTAAIVIPSVFTLLFIQTFC